MGGLTTCDNDERVPSTEDELTITTAETTSTVAGPPLADVTETT